MVLRNRERRKLFCHLGIDTERNQTQFQPNRFYCFHYIGLISNSQIKWILSHIQNLSFPQIQVGKIHAPHVSSVEHYRTVQKRRQLLFSGESNNPYYDDDDDDDDCDDDGDEDDDDEEEGQV